MILVTGATGTVGRHVVAELAARGVSFRVLSRFAAKARSLLGPDIDVVEGDLADPASLGSAFTGTTALFLATNMDPKAVGWHENALRAAQEAGVQHVVRLSQLAAHRKSRLQAARWHAEINEALARSGLSFTILAPHYFMSNTLAAAGSLRAEGVFYGHSGEGKVAVVDPRDIAAVAAAVMVAPAAYVGKELVITGPQALSGAEMADVMSRVLEMQVRYVDIDGAAYRQEMIEAGYPPWLADDLVTMAATFARGLGAQVLPTVQQVTGRPARTFETFMRDHASNFLGYAPLGAPGAVPA